MEGDLKYLVPLPLAVMSFDPPKISWTSAKHSFSTVAEDEHLMEHADRFQAKKILDFEWKDISVSCHLVLSQLKQLSIKDVSPDEFFSFKVD